MNTWKQRYVFSDWSSPDWYLVSRDHNPTLPPTHEQRVEAWNIRSRHDKISVGRSVGSVGPSINRVSESEIRDGVKLYHQRKHHLLLMEHAVPMICLSVCLLLLLLLLQLACRTWCTFSDSLPRSLLHMHHHRHHHHEKMVITDSLGRETERVYDVPASCKSISTCEITKH